MGVCKVLGSLGDFGIFGDFCKVGLVGWSVEISANGAIVHVVCRNSEMVIFVKTVPVGLGPVFGKAEYLKYKGGQEKTIVYLRGCKLSTQAKNRDETSPSL